MQRRLEIWKEGGFNALVKEGKAIQKRIQTSKRTTKMNITRAFSNLVFQGKVGAACKLINSTDGGPLEVNNSVIELLAQKHPEGKEAKPEALIGNENPRFVEPIIYEGLDSSLIMKSALQTRGSGGPTKIDADVWRQLLCSKSFMPASEGLCEQISTFAKHLCSEYVDPSCLTEFTACRLIPLDKDPGSSDLKIRPIGIGEVLRRICGKATMMLLKPELVDAAGPLQTCAGRAGGIDAAIHAMRDIFDDDETEGMLLVDAENAFNSLNREASLKNMNKICPEIAKYLINTYRQPSRLYINNTDGQFIMSEEGSTQGDNAAMNMYACSIKPLIDLLNKPDSYQNAGVEKVKQVWYADDSGAAGKISALLIWWKELCKFGPLLGYHPRSDKCHIIVKTQRDLELAERAFAGSEIKITLRGRPYLGSVIGTTEYQHEYVEGKVKEWIADVEEISKIAEVEPHTAYYGFVNGLCRRWTFLMRSTNQIAHLFQPLENTIKDVFLPALIGKTITELERKIIALPVRFGGMGIPNPTKVADLEYQSSVKITSNLQRAIRSQMSTIDNNINRDEMKRLKSQIKKEKQTLYQTDLSNIITDPQITDALKRSLELAGEKGASMWMVTSPNREHGFYLNKQEFKDALGLRYNWPIKGIPATCACGKPNDIDHTLTCKKGGYVILRHNTLRDTQAEILQNACYDVQIEPGLLPITGEVLQATTTSEERARLDISARGVWSPMERVFFDVRVTHPNTQTNRSKSLRQIYKENGREKKAKYNQRVIEVEKATFVPLVFTTSGGMGPECERLNKTLAEIISRKKNESYSDVISYIRKKLRFALLKATLIALRGFKGKSMRQTVNVSEVDYNLMQ